MEAKGRPKTQPLHGQRRLAPGSGLRSEKVYRQKFSAANLEKLKVLRADCTPARTERRQNRTRNPDIEQRVTYVGPKGQRLSDRPT